MTSGPELGLTVLAAALVAAPVALLVGLLVRRALQRRQDELVRVQGQGLALISSQLTDTLDRIHTRLAAVGQELGAGQSAASESLQRSLREQLQSGLATLSGQLTAAHESLGGSLAGTTEVFGDVQESLGRLTQMSARMEQLAAAVEDLDRVLRVPKLRGILGEQNLENLLAQILPRRLWETQHQFADGRVADAVVRVGELLVPIDSKFPLESFRRLAEAGEADAQSQARRELTRAVKQRVHEIATRYLRPAEGTTDFAFMFVPAEGVYGELVAGPESPELLEFALARRVVPVSPGSLYAYLSTVSLGLRGAGLDGRARELVSGLEAATLELESLTEDLMTLGRHLANASQRFGDAEKHLAGLKRRIADLRQEL